jgi:hypothetical protein
MDLNDIFETGKPNLKKLVISPTHKRSEGRAPVWRSEYTSKAAALQGDPSETAATLNVKLRTSVAACVVVVTVGYRLFSLFLFSNLFEPPRRTLNLRLKNLSGEF